jgi:hypothetical protein
MNTDPRENTEKWVGLLIGFIVFTAVGIFITYLVGLVSTLECSKATGGKATCTLTTSFMNLHTVKQQSIQELKSAYMDESCDDSCTYRVILVTGYGDQPLTSSLDSDHSGKQRMIDQVNKFTSNPDSDSLKISDGGGFFILIPLIFLAVGVGCGISLVVSLIKFLIAVRKETD